MLLTILIIMYVIACLFLILIVLLQAGKGGGMGAAFGGATSSGSVFGGRGAATFMGKMTWIMAFLFIVLSVGISLNIAAQKASVDPDAAVETESEGGAEDGDEGE